MTNFIVTIDGLASSGKGTLARALADQFDLAMLDTGLLYRKIGLEAYRKNLSPDDETALVALAEHIAKNLNWADLSDPDLRGPEASSGASVYSTLAGVRAALIPLQRHFAHTPPAHMNGKPCRGVVMDGRDMGTVICPDAPVKFFITASAEERARRRVAYLQARGFSFDYDIILKDLVERDTRDTTRAVAPAVPAPDAIVIDTTQLSIAEVISRAIDVVARHIDR
jgi:CMP/dCMP kinase